MYRVYKGVTHRKDISMIIMDKQEQIKNNQDVLVSRVDDLYDKLGALELYIKSLEQTIYELKEKLNESRIPY